MQATMWEQHPTAKLSTEFSLLKPSSLNSYIRFQKYAELYPTLKKIKYVAVTAQDVEMMDVDPVVEKKSRTKSETLTSHFRVVKNNNMVPKSFTEKEALAIPIQPRKGHGHEVNIIFIEFHVLIEC